MKNIFIIIYKELKTIKFYIINLVIIESRSL